MREAGWYSDWQHANHTSHFDGRYELDRKNLVRNYKSLNEWIDRPRPLTLLEVGCATGEFYRYLRLRYPSVSYYGLDISEPAIGRARAKYPTAKFFVARPDTRLPEVLRELGVPPTFELVYAKDVLHHQTRPFEFLADLLSVGSEAVILRCRTRDVGPTELDSEKSCQYHYGGWMPYIVINLSELIGVIADVAPDAEVAVLRHHVILGGQHGRFLPKECYLRETGTAETAIGIFKKTANLGRVTVEDRPDGNPRYTLGYQLRRGLRRVVGVLSAR